MQQQVSEVFAAFIGLDWADTKHDGCLQAAGTAQRAFLRLEHSPEAINAWGQTLRTRFNGHPVAVCLELNKGPIVSALRNSDCLVLFPVNPLTVAKYRAALTPSRATRTPHHFGRLFPCPPRALDRPYRHPHRGHQERPSADHR